jgi:3-hydroxyacyl-[acyl-carrier-protein] dehydratase
MGDAGSVLPDGSVAIEGQGGDRIVTSTWVDPDLPLLAGHYPDFPIFPGVCLIQCAHDSVRAAAGQRDREVVLEEVDRTRFHHPVFPGDRVRTEVRIDEGVPGHWRCSAVLYAAGVKVADVRLLYSVR